MSASWSGGQALAALDLRDHLVAAALDAEAVDVVAAQQRREVAAGLAQVDALRAHLVAVEDDLGLRLVELQVGVGEHEQAAGERLPHQLVRRTRRAAAARRSRRSRSRPGSRRRRAAAAASAGSRARRGSATAGPTTPSCSCCVVLRALAPRLRHHAAEAAGRERDLEDAVRLGERLVDVVRSASRRASSGRASSSRRPGRSRRRRPGPRRAPAPAARTGRRARSAAPRSPTARAPPAGTRSVPASARDVGAAHVVEAPVDQAGEAALGVAGAQQLRAHHRRQRQRHDAGHDHRAGQRERELAEQRARSGRPGSPTGV